MDIKINAKRLTLLAIGEIILLIILSILFGIKNYYDYFTGAFVGIVAVLSLFWIWVVINSIRKDKKNKSK